jgi:hypothetical protein
MDLNTNDRGRLLYVALGFLGLDVPPAVQPSGLRALHAWLDTWDGIGLIEHGLARQERDLELIRYGDRRAAAIYWTGLVHPTAQATGATSPTPGQVRTRGTPMGARHG